MLTSLNASVNRLLAARRELECKFRAIRPATSSVDGGIENYLSFQLLLALETRVRGDVVTVGEPTLSALCERFTGADDCAVTRQALRVSLDESGASQKMLTEKEIRKRVQLMKERMINWRDEKFKKFWLRRCVDVWKAPELRVDFLAAQAAQAAMADAGDEEGAKVRLCMTRKCAHTRTTHTQQRSLELQPHPTHTCTKPTAEKAPQQRSNERRCQAQRWPFDDGRCRPIQRRHNAGTSGRSQW